MMIVSSNFCIMSRILVKVDIDKEFNLCARTIVIDAI